MTLTDMSYLPWQWAAACWVRAAMVTAPVLLVCWSMHYYHRHAWTAALAGHPPARTRRPAPIARVADGWARRHRNAMVDPEVEEMPLVMLVQASRVATQWWGQDAQLRDGVAHLLLGIQRLLVADHGQRLDPGTVDDELHALAARIGFDLATERYADGEPL